MPNIGSRLKKFRSAQGLSMREAAQLIGVPETTYREWEYGRQIRGEPYARIAEVFGVSIETLLGKDTSNINIEQRLCRIKQDIEMVQAEIRKTKK